MKAVVAAFNQEKALVGAFSVIVQPVVEPMDRFAALTRNAAAEGNMCRQNKQPTLGKPLLKLYFGASLQLQLLVPKSTKRILCKLQYKRAVVADYRCSFAELGPSRTSLTGLNKRKHVSAKQPE